MSFTYIATWEPWDPSRSIRNPKIPQVWPLLCLSRSNSSRITAWPSFAIYPSPMYSHIRYLAPNPINQAPNNTTSLTSCCLSRSNGSRVTAWPSFAIYPCTDTCHSNVQPCERPGTHSKQSSTPKYSQFDLLHYSLTNFCTLPMYWHMSSTCAAMWETWEPSQSIRHPKIPIVPC